MKNKRKIYKYPKDRKAWNKGLTKETDERVAKGVEKLNIIRKNRTVWNKGLTKETDERVKKNGESVSKTMKKKILEGIFTPSKHTKEFLIRTSIRQSLHNSGGKSKWYEVANKKVQGTWERDIALILEILNIKWIKPKNIKDSWKYLINNKIKHYTPDFYLKDYNIYLEIKGYWWGNDKEKMKEIALQYPDRKIVFIEKKEFYKIKNNNKEIFNYIN